MFKFQNQNGKKKEKNFWVTKRGNKGLQIGAGFKNYRSGQQRLQIGAALRILNWGKKITNRGKEISNRGKEI